MLEISPSEGLKMTQVKKEFGIKTDKPECECICNELGMEGKCHYLSLDSGSGEGPSRKCRIALREY